MDLLCYTLISYISRACRASILSLVALFIYWLGKVYFVLFLFQKLTLFFSLKNIYKYSLHERASGKTVDWQSLFQTPLLDSFIEFIRKTFIKMSTYIYHFHGICIWFLNELTLSAKLTHDCSLCGLLISLHISVSHPQCVPDLAWGGHGQVARCSKETNTFAYAKTMDRYLVMWCKVLR